MFFDAKHGPRAASWCMGLNCTEVASSCIIRFHVKTLFCSWHTPRVTWRSCLAVKVKDICVSFITRRCLGDVVTSEDRPCHIMDY